MLKNILVQEAYNKLLEHHTESESAYIVLNSLAILGAKKVIIQNNLDENSFISINKYKYPERLALFIQTTNEKSVEWQNMSFAKLALSLLLSLQFHKLNRITKGSNKRIICLIFMIYTSSLLSSFTISIPIRIIEITKKENGTMNIIL